MISDIIASGERSVLDDDTIPEEFYKECLKHSGNTVIYLECNPGEGKLNAKWKLMIKEER